jgi:hypothetical protein
VAKRRDNGREPAAIHSVSLLEGYIGTGGVASAKEPTAAYYRAVAEEIVRNARKAQNPDIRSELLELAERFRRMAIYVERRYPARSGRAER